MFASDKDPRCQGQIRRRAVIYDVDFPAQKETSHHGTTSFETSDLVQANPFRDPLFQKKQTGYMWPIGNNRSSYLIICPPRPLSSTGKESKRLRQKCGSRENSRTQSCRINRREPYEFQILIFQFESANRW